MDENNEMFTEHFLRENASGLTRIVRDASEKDLKLLLIDKKILGILAVDCFKLGAEAALDALEFISKKNRGTNGKNSS